MQKFVINEWPMTKQCFRDNRVLFGQVKRYSISDMKNIINFDYDNGKRKQDDNNSQNKNLNKKLNYQ